MSVYVSDFATWTVTHDDAPGGAHGGTIDPYTISYIQNMDGTHNHNYLAVTCPVCGSVSTHPVGGGAQPPLVQQMFVEKSASEGCACGNIEAGNENLSDAHAHLCCDRMDGPDRWQI